MTLTSAPHRTARAPRVRPFHPAPHPTRWHPGGDRVRPVHDDEPDCPVLAREQAGGYDAGGQPSGHHDGPDTVAGQAGPGEGSSQDVREVARQLRQVARQLAGLVAEEGRVEGGELAALSTTLAALEVAQAAAVELTGQVQRRGAAERSAGLPLEHLLALETRLTRPDRRMLASAAEILRGMPHLAAAFRAGAVGWAEVRTIVCEVRRLPATDRTEIDDGFAQVSNIARRDADRLLDEVRAAVAALQPDKETNDTARTIERRFLALQPMLDGTGGTGYFELDDEAFAIVAAGLEAAMPPPSAGPNDVTRDAIGHADEPDPEEGETAEGDPAFCDPIAHRSRVRQRADALVLLAETFLAGARPDGTLRRARPRLLITCELTDLAGDATSQAARLLAALPGMKPAVTREALGRLASDADLQLVIQDHGQIVGVSAPTQTIPARGRAAVAARDQGCRFPGCRMPIQFTDCHHIQPREDEGPTIVSNLVALCRRHHTAITEGRWQLTMTPDGTVTVQRGRRRATSDPPATTLFRGPPRHPPRPRRPEPDPPGAPSGTDPPGHPPGDPPF